MDSTFDGLPEPMSEPCAADFLGVSATELEDARERREEQTRGAEEHMHDVRFVGLNGDAAVIVEEPTYDNGVFECGGDVRIFALSDVSCFTAMQGGDYRVTLSGGEVFYVTEEDFEKLVSNTYGFNFRADDPWS
nr:MAG TPA: hypothetical protein [Caudoviricetes sp.]